MARQNVETTDTLEQFRQKVNTNEAELYDSSNVGFEDTSLEDPLASTNVRDAIVEEKDLRRALDDSLADHVSSGGHPAAAISLADADGKYTATNGEEAFGEVKDDLTAHANQASSAHPASAISITDAGGNYAATNAENALAEVRDALETHESASPAHAASDLSISDVGNFYVGSTVEEALQEIGGGEPGGGSGATDLDGLTDVDIATTPPADGQALVFDDADDLWKPSTVQTLPANALDRQTSRHDGTSPLWGTSSPELVRMGVTGAVQTGQRDPTPCLGLAGILRRCYVSVTDPSTSGPVTVELRKQTGATGTPTITTLQTLTLPVNTHYIDLSGFSDALVATDRLVLNVTAAGTGATDLAVVARIIPDVNP